MAALLVFLGVAAALWLSLASGDQRDGRSGGGGTVRVLDGDRPLLEGRVERLQREMRPWLRRVPARRTRRRGAAKVAYVARRAELERRVRRATRAGGGPVRVPERAVAASARLPIYRQAHRNNCETAALSMLLTARRVRVGQLQLQRRLPRSKPIDPVVDGRGATTWGDPSRGFVGRPEGGGPAGGYGVTSPRSPLWPAAMVSRCEASAGVGPQRSTAASWRAVP